MALLLLALNTAVLVGIIKYLKLVRPKSGDEMAPRANSPPQTKVAKIMKVFPGAKNIKNKVNNVIKTTSSFELNPAEKQDDDK